MAPTPSHRSTREWPLLILALALVGAVALPLGQGLLGEGGLGMFAEWDAARWGKLLLGPEQIICYCCFTWACLILASRWWEVRRQRKAFALNLLPDEEGTRILYEDARPLLRRVEQTIQQKGPTILTNMLRMSLAKFLISRSSKDVSEALRTQAETEQGRLASTLATLNYLVWAIPAIGFLGTVRGLAGSLTMATAAGDVSDAEFLEQVSRYLNIAFDSTFVALFLSLVLMFFLHSLQREEDNLVIDCQQYCNEHLINRLYDPQTFDDEDEAVGFGHDFDTRQTSLIQRDVRLTS